MCVIICSVSDSPAQVEPREVRGYGVSSLWIPCTGPGLYGFTSQNELQSFWADLCQRRVKVGGTEVGGRQCHRTEEEALGRGRRKRREGGKQSRGVCVRVWAQWTRPAAQSERPEPGKAGLHVFCCPRVSQVFICLVSH